MQAEMIDTRDVKIEDRIPKTMTMLPIDVNGLLSQRDIAVILRVDPSYIREMRNQGRLPLPDVHLKNRPRWWYRTIKSIIDSGEI